MARPPGAPAIAPPPPVIGRGCGTGKDEDYQAFLRMLGEGLQRYPVELFSFTLMPNHWHLVLRPIEDGMMGRLLRWVTATHTLRYHVHYQTSGEGHLYQSRFKSFPVAEDDHFLVVCRYVERNPLRANLVGRAEELQALRNCVRRGRPFGAQAWVEEVAQRTGLGYTLRVRGRPRKQQA